MKIGHTMTPKDHPLEPEWLSTRETAEVLNVNTRVVLDMIKDGRLSAIKLGKGFRIKKDALDGLAD